jgi:hypothetical protein
MDDKLFWEAVKALHIDHPVYDWAVLESGEVQLWVGGPEPLVYRPPTADPPLTAVIGIGKTITGRLELVGITSLETLLTAEIETIATAAKVTAVIAEDWQRQARKLKG